MGKEPGWESGDQSCDSGSATSSQLTMGPRERFASILVLVLILKTMKNIY